MKKTFYLLPLCCALFFMNGCGKDDEYVTSGSIKIKQTNVERFGDIFEATYDNGMILYYSQRIGQDKEVEVVKDPENTYKYDGDIAIPSTLIYGNTIYTVTAIGDSAFKNTGITSIQFPENIDSIGNYAFYKCDALLEITIGENVSYIGYKAFSECANINSIYFNTSSLPKYDAFSNCNSLRNLYINAQRPLLEGFYDCTNLDNVSFSDDVEKFLIGDGAFYKCEALKFLNLERCAFIRTNAFSYSGLTEAVVDSIKDLSTGFEYCTRLKKVVLGENINSIAFAAFAYCESLDSLIFKGKIPPYICIAEGGYIGDVYDLGMDTLNIYTPQGCIDVYKEAFSDINRYITTNTIFSIHELD